MHPTIIPALSRRQSDETDASPRVRQPHFECRDLAPALQLDVYVPGVEAGDVEITTRGPDLVVRARKPQRVRPNWRALHLEAAQHDYELKLRLGLGFEFTALHADMRDGVLHIVVPKRQSGVARIHARRVA
ncbi:MAG: heat-shock protein Hsp20 [Opitutus sp.]|nr:heat-shock protein Hsp20 [Opitutus sp.]